jgi:hypothetical protein
VEIVSTIAVNISGSRLERHHRHLSTPGLCSIVNISIIFVSVRLLSVHCISDHISGKLHIRLTASAITGSIKTHCHSFQTLGPGPAGNGTYNLRLRIAAHFCGAVSLVILAIEHPSSSPAASWLTDLKPSWSRVTINLTVLPIHDPPALAAAAIVAAAAGSATGSGSVGELVHVSARVWSVAVDAATDATEITRVLPTAAAATQFPDERALWPVAMAVAVAEEGSSGLLAAAPQILKNGTLVGKNP